MKYAFSDTVVLSIITCTQQWYVKHVVASKSAKVSDDVMLFNFTPQGFLWDDITNVATKMTSKHSEVSSPH